MSRRKGGFPKIWHRPHERQCFGPQLWPVSLPSPKLRSWSGHTQANHGSSEVSPLWWQNLTGAAFQTWAVRAHICASWAGDRHILTTKTGQLESDGYSRCFQSKIKFNMETAIFFYQISIITKTVPSVASPPVLRALPCPAIPKTVYLLHKEALRELRHGICKALENAQEITRNRGKQTMDCYSTYILVEVCSF